MPSFGSELEEYRAIMSGKKPVLGLFLADFWAASSKLHAAVEDDWSSRNRSRLRHEADT